MKRIGKLIPHINIILSVIFVVFLVLDELNPTMNFVNNNISKIMLVVLCISSIITGLMEVFYQRK